MSEAEFDNAYDNGFKAGVDSIKTKLAEAEAVCETLKRIARQFLLDTGCSCNACKKLDSLIEAPPSTALAEMLEPVEKALQGAVKYTAQEVESSSGKHCYKNPALVCLEEALAHIRAMKGEK